MPFKVKHRYVVSKASSSSRLAAFYSLCRCLLLFLITRTSCFVWQFERVQILFGRKEWCFSLYEIPRGPLAILKLVLVGVMDFIDFI
jgi:hypothetical protein